MLSRFKASTWRMIASGLLGLAVVSAGAAGILAQHGASASTAHAAKVIQTHHGSAAGVRSGSVDLSTLKPATAAQIAALPDVTKFSNRQLKTRAQMEADRQWELAHPGSVPKSLPLRVPGRINSYGGGLTPVLQSGANGMNLSTAPSCNCAPPDQAIAAAPGYVVEGVNNLFTIYNASYGVIKGPYTPAQLFAPVFHAGDGFSDPQITFDAERAKYMISWLEINSAGTADYLDFAISRDSTPYTPTNFKVFQIAATSFGPTVDNFCDYDTLGYDFWGMYVTCVDFSASVSGNSGNTVLAFNTNGLLNGALTWWWYSTIFDGQSTCGAGSSACPAYRISPTMEDGVPQAEWITASDAGDLGATTTSDLTVCALTNTHALTGSTAPTLTCTLTSLPNTYNDPSYASQPGAAGSIYPGVGYKQVAYRNGQLYFALPISLSCGTGLVDGLFWAVVDPQLTTIAAHSPQWVNGIYSSYSQDGYWCYTDSDTYMPTAMADTEGDVALVFNASSLSLDPGIYAAGRTAADAPFTMDQGSNGIFVVGGSNTNSNGRWGDYSACALTTNLVTRGIMYCAGEYGGANSGLGGWDTYMYALRLQ